MKTLLAIIAAVAVGLAVAWANRLDLLMWGAPIMADLTDPIGPNVPTAWPAGPDSAAQPPRERPPNIVLIFADDLGYNDVSFTNGGAADGSVRTPHIDAIAREGVTFTNGYAANAVCAPSRASILTGRYSTRFGFEFTPFPRIGATISEWMNEATAPLPTIIRHDLLDQLPDMRDMGLPDSEVTIAEVLRDAGYYTAHIGKWHLGAEPGLRPGDQGFDDSLYMAGTFYLPEDHPEVVNAMDENSGIERMVWTMARYAAQWNGGPLFEPDGYLTDYYTDEAVKVIEANRHRPFFLYLAHWGIHNPLQSLRSDYDAVAHIEDHALRVYAGMILSMDRSVRRIEEALEAHGLAENTLSSSPATTAARATSGCRRERAVPRLEADPLRGGLHVPFAARWPARIAPGTVVDDRCTTSTSSRRSLPPPAPVCLATASSTAWTCCPTRAARRTASRTRRCSGGRATSRRCCTKAGR